MEQLISAMSSQTIQVPRVLHTVIIFINTGSGGKEGDQLLNIVSKDPEINQVYSTYLYIFKINDSASKKIGLDLLRSLTNEANTEINKIVVMAGGGDGTVNWLLTQIINQNIDYSKFAFGALPLGTGNDFAKNLGWTEVTLFKGKSGVKDFFSKIKRSTFQDFDVWQIEVQYDKQGQIMQIEDGLEKKIQKQPFIKQMTNYFSFGMDARVGFNFDKKRSNFQFLNLVLYCLIGCCNRCKRIPSVEKVVSTMKQTQQQDEQINLIFSSETDKLRLKKFRNILALNINSYMGGVKGVWEHSRDSGIKSVVNQPSSHSDGLLQFVAFKHQWSLGFQRMWNGQARKIAQGKGDFRLQFDQNCHYTYLNFDGQYFKIYKPKSLIIRRSPFFKTRKLRVIRCPQN